MVSDVTDAAMGCPDSEVVHAGALGSTEDNGSADLHAWQMSMPVREQRAWYFLRESVAQPSGRWEKTTEKLTRQQQ